MNSKQFQDAVKNAYKKYFPNGYINISKLHYGDTGCSIFCGLIDNINDVGSKIRANDPLSVAMFIHDTLVFNDESTELENIVIEFDSSYLSVLPDNPYMYCQPHKIRARKINAEPSKALVLLDKHFSKVKAVVDQQRDLNRIIQQEKIPAQYL